MTRNEGTGVFTSYLLRAFLKSELIIHIFYWANKNLVRLQKTILLVNLLVSMQSRVSRHKVTPRDALVRTMIYHMSVPVRFSFLNVIEITVLWRSRSLLHREKR